MRSILFVCGLAATAALAAPTSARPDCPCPLPVLVITDPAPGDGFNTKSVISTTVVYRNMSPGDVFTITVKEASNPNRLKLAFATTFTIPPNGLPSGTLVVNIGQLPVGYYRLDVTSSNVGSNADTTTFPVGQSP